MRDPWNKTKSTIVHINYNNEDSSNKLLQVAILCLFLLISSILVIFILWQIGDDESHTLNYFSSYDFKNMVLSMVNDSNEFRQLFLDHEESIEPSNFVGELRVIDTNFRVLYSKTLNKDTLRNFPADLPLDGKFNWDDSSENWERIRQVRSVNDVDPKMVKEKKYIVPLKRRFVNCERFKPVAQGKYLVSPSVSTLHACYKHGVSLAELEKGVTRSQANDQRYQLSNLYVSCEEAFDPQRLDELTDELKDDYARCKWSGGIEPERQRAIEQRFPATLITDDQMDGPITLDLRRFVECSHVEMEFFEDYFESPSMEALDKCQKFGVTYGELESGIVRNPQPEQLRFDVGNLYISCKDVFDGHVDYMTSELKDDYRRCKSVGAINSHVQKLIENKFYETLNEERGTREKSTEKPTTVTPSTTTTTASSSTKRPYTFSNCKRIENKPYLICIKVIKVYSTPIKSILGDTSVFV